MTHMTWKGAGGMSRYVALTPIDHGAARAYNPGDPVHADNVRVNGYVVGEQVAEEGSAEARAVLVGLGMLPAGPDTPTSDTEASADDAGLDPAEATVDAVNEWLDQHPDQAPAVLAAEADGKHRAGIIHGRHGTPPDVAETGA